MPNKNFLKFTSYLIKRPYLLVAICCVILPAWADNTDTISPAETNNTVISQTSLNSASAAVIERNASNPQPLMNVNDPQASLIPTPPTVSAIGYILIDAQSGNVIAAKNADQTMAPASLTKLMTMYIISGVLQDGQIKMDDSVRISKNAWQTGGSRMFLREGQYVTVSDLLKGVIIDSGNDACVAMAEYVGGSQDSFVNMMNQQAQKLGMTHTHYTDATGLPNPEHYSTPRDLSILARAIVLNYPQDYQWYKEKWLSFNGIKQPNRNRLLWRDPSVDGMKTGHTDEAGYCLVASAQRNSTRLIAVVMGAPSDEARFNDAESLLTYGYHFFETHKLYGTNEKLTDIRVWQGKEKRIGLGINNDLYVTIPRGKYNNLKASINIQLPIIAPVSKGQNLGILTISLSDKPIANVPLIALDDDPKGNAWIRLKDKISLSLQRIFHKNTNLSK